MFKYNSCTRNNFHNSVDFGDIAVVEKEVLIFVDLNDNLMLRLTIGSQFCVVNHFKS